MSAQSENRRKWREFQIAQGKARREDVEWMAATGESLSGAARRLEMKPDALERWCEKHGLRAELTRMRQREPFYVANECHATNRRVS